MHSLIELENFLPFSDRLATGGQPSALQLATLHSLGYELVINLALPTSTNALPDEATLVQSQGMEYVSIPVMWEEPTLEDLAQFFQVMAQNRDKAIFVHCAKNMRVSAFMYLYRVLCQGMDTEQAKAELHRIWIPNERWQQFIDQALAHYGEGGSRERLPD